MGDNDIVLVCVLIIFCTIIFGGALGLSVTGGDVEIPDTSDMQTKPSSGFFGLLETVGGMLSWIWDGIVFFFAILSFQVPGMPGWISMIYIILLLLPLFVLVKTIRGSNG